MFLTVEDLRKASIRRTNGGLYLGGKKKEDTGVTKRLNRFHKAQNHASNQQVRREMNVAADKSEGKNPRPGVINGAAAPYRYTYSGPKARGGGND